MSKFQVHRIIVGKWKENCYVISESDGLALIIDPGDEPERIAEYLDANNLKPLAILITHGHHDHVGAVAGLREQYEVPWYIHSREMNTLRHANLLRKFFDATEILDLPAPDGYMEELGSPITIGGFSIEAIETAGHTPGSISLVIGDSLFTGDTLFKRTVGRVDLPGGDKVALGDSLRRICGQEPELMVFPGHGSSETLSAIKAGNTALQELLSEN